MSLRGADDGERIRLQPYVPLKESVSWTMASSYWEHSGASAFFGSAVPFRVTSDGFLSEKAAEVLFFSLAAAELEDRPESRVIRVLELGAGSGMFARAFLDSFRLLCQRYRRDFYDRLHYVATDRAKRMREDMVRLGVLAQHEGHFEIAAADANQAGFGLNIADGSGTPAPFQAVFLNYVLDILPATVLRIEADRILEVRVQTSLLPNLLPEGVGPAAAPDWPPDGNLEEFMSVDEFVALLPALAMEYDYVPVERDLPFESTAAAAADPARPFLLHSYGALQCLETCTGLVSPGGFVLVGDYPCLPFDEEARVFPWQQYGGSVSMGLNLPLLRTHFRNRSGWRWCEPEEDGRFLSLRLLGNGVSHALCERFRAVFGKAAFDSLYAPMADARRHREEGRMREALQSFELAHSRQHRNWGVKTEFAEFLLNDLGETDRALRIANSGLDDNPICPWLWQTVGECCSRLGRAKDAEEARARARRLAGSPGTNV